MLKIKMKYLLVILTIANAATTFAHEEKVKFTLYEGVFNAGYVDHGGYVNFSGPSIIASYKNSKFAAGMLPSLRFKEDKKTPKNAFVTPNLGVGFTYSYKFWSVQLPLYYNAKTATQDGKWHVGLGVGIRANWLNKKK